MSLIKFNTVLRLEVINIIYENEKKELLRVLSLYKTLLYRQVMCLIPDKPDSTKRKILKKLHQDRRIFFIDEYVSVFETLDSVDQDLIKCFWVVLDFYERLEYHSVSEFPVKIYFVTGKGQSFDVIYIPQNMNRILMDTLIDTDTTKILVLEDKEQLKNIKLPDNSYFCTIENEEVSYFRTI